MAAKDIRPLTTKKYRCGTRLGQKVDMPVNGSDKHRRGINF